MSGDLTAGLQFTGDNAKDAAGDRLDGHKRIMVKPMSDDAGRAIRLNLVGEYAAENYGLKFRLRFDERTLGAERSRLSDVMGILNYGYVWASMFNNKLKMTGGLIDNAVWKTAGDQEFHYSNGTGVRFEVTPMEGLNAGFLFNFPTNAYNQSASLDPIQMLTEIGLGVGYTNSAVDIAAGLRLDSNADGGGDYSAYDGDLPEYYRLLVDAAYSLTIPNGGSWYWDNTITPGIPVVAYNDRTVPLTSAKEMRAYIGANIKMVEKLHAAVEAEFYNLGAFGGTYEAATAAGMATPGSVYEGLLLDNAAGRVISPKGLGAIWVDEKISYDVSDKLNAGITMHQILFGGKSDGADKAKFNPEFRFQPFLTFKLNDKAELGFKATYFIKSDYYKLKADVKPSLTYMIGDKAKLIVFYKLDINQLQAQTDPVMSNTFQIDMKWSF